MRTVSITGIVVCVLTVLVRIRLIWLRPRTVDMKPGTGGSAGSAYLRTTLNPDAPLISHALAERGVHVDYRGNVLRLGPAPYLTDEQLREAVSVLAEVVS